jgi:AcrR family transcriptional regulator
MQRDIPSDRFEQLVDAATRIFIECGYKRTQMADVAEAMGVAKGTIYRHVESKEALFDLAVRRADSPRPLQPPPDLPVPTPAAGATVDYVTWELAKSPMLRHLETLLAAKRRGDARLELELFVRALYDNLSRRRYALKLVDTSAKDLPELGAVWFDTVRSDLVHLLTKYLEDRIGARLLRPVRDPRAAARVIVEIAVFWAVHRHWDPRPQPITDFAAKEIVVDFTVGALTKGKGR